MLERYLQSRFRVDFSSPVVRSRCRRVLLLSFLIVALSIADLWITLTFLHTVGMEEMNPVASFIIRNQSPLGLVLFKFGSMMACVSLILLVRHRFQGEMAAWTAAAILTALTIRWSDYTAEAIRMQDTVSIMEAQNAGTWLTFDRRLVAAPLP